MDADDILGDGRLTLSIDKHSIEVLDRTQAVASKTEVVGRSSGTSITEVKCLLSVVRRSWVAIRNSHLGQTQSVQNISAIVLEIVNNSTLSRIEANSESPLLPLD